MKLLTLRWQSSFNFYSEDSINNNNSINISSVTHAIDEWRIITVITNLPPFECKLNGVKSTCHALAIIGINLTTWWPWWVNKKWDRARNVFVTGKKTGTTVKHDSTKLRANTVMRYHSTGIHWLVKMDSTLSLYAGYGLLLVRSNMCSKN